MKIKRYGWKRDLPDHRDYMYSVVKPVTLPVSIDLRPHCPPIYDQGNLGSCTANAIAGAIQFERMRQKEVPNFIPSRLFIYYNERVIEGTVPWDDGAMLRDGIKSIATQGVCSETMWLYNVNEFAVTPPPSCYSLATKYKAVQYQRLVNTNLFLLRQCLAQGFPFVFGFSVYESFESDLVAKNGIVPMPSLDEQLLGGHAVMAVGYSDLQDRFICRNSWGTGWGMAGYFTIPYAYLTNPYLADDFWTIQLES